MAIELYDETLSIVRLAKSLHDADRADIIDRCFYDTIDYDNYYEIILRLTEEIFSGYYSRYDDNAEEECQIFMDDVISDYYTLAWQYSQSHRHVEYDRNPFIVSAYNEAQKWLNISYSMGWKLLGYTKSKAAARKSKLIVYTCSCEFCDNQHLAYGLLKLYQWFKAQCKGYKTQRTEVLAA